MDFDFIEGLTEEQINELYSDVANNNEILANNVWQVQCSNGIKGFYTQYKTYYDRGWVGFRAYTVQYNSERGLVLVDTCGSGNWGYAQMISVFDDSNAQCASTWEVKCSNGYNTFANQYAEGGCFNYSLIGFSAYTVQYAPKFILYEACGPGIPGYAQLIMIKR